MGPHKRIVVCGGTGFLGSRICRAAAARSWHVTSLSRTGTPRWDSITASADPPAWAGSVEWARADALNPESYAAFLAGADAVVHSMGILLEADYKAVLSGRESVIAGLGRAFAARKAGGRRGPLEEGDTGGESDGQLTYELMNRDSAIALAKEAAKQKAEAFVYISAAGGAPVLPTRYITTKREAEETIASSFPGMRSIFIRPGFLYDASRMFTVPLAYLVFPFTALNSLIGGRLSGLAGAAVEKPLKADDVANAVVEAIEDSSVRGPVGTSKIEELARKAWRKGML